MLNEIVKITAYIHSLSDLLTLRFLPISMYNRWLDNLNLLININILCLQVSLSMFVGKNYRHDVDINDLWKM
jgi:hypothetical protein